MEYILLVVGFVLLVKGADFFVEGSSSVAKLLRVPSVIIGLTIAGINTVEELCNRTPEDMMKVRNLGRKSLEEVLAKLKELGLELNPSEE